MQALVRSANEMRWRHAALRSQTLDVSHRDRENGVLAFRRWTEQGDVVLTVANFSEREWTNFDYAVNTGVGGNWEEISTAKLRSLAAIPTRATAR